MFSPMPSLPPSLLLDVRRGRQVIGVGMGLDQPFDLEVMVANEADDLVGRLIADAARRVVDVHDAVDDGAGVGSWVLDDIADRVGRLVEERRDLGFDD